MLLLVAKEDKMLPFFEHLSAQLKFYHGSNGYLKTNNSLHQKWRETKLKGGN